MSSYDAAPRSIEHGTSQPQERRVTAWVGKSVVFVGHLTSSEDMTIDGRVEGTINVPHHVLIVGPDADIHASIVAKNVIVLGAVTGTITASNKVDLRDTGAVNGEILCPQLVMAEGAIFQGRRDTTDPKREKLPALP